MGQRRQFFFSSRSHNQKFVCSQSALMFLSIAVAKYSLLATKEIWNFGSNIRAISKRI